MKLFLNTALFLIFGSWALAATFDPIEKDVISEMKCAKRIVEHNIGGFEGFKFLQDNLRQSVGLYRNNQALGYALIKCNEFISSHPDHGFNYTGAFLSYIPAGVSQRASQPTPEIAILTELAFPSVSCHEGVVDGALGGWWGGLLDVRAGLCKSTNGHWFLRADLGGDFGRGAILGVVTVGIGSGKDVATYVQIHQLVNTLQIRVRSLGFILGAGNAEGSYSKKLVRGDDKLPDVGTVDGAIGGGLGFIAMIGKDLDVKLPLNGTSDSIVLNTFRKAIVVTPPPPASIPPHVFAAPLALPNPYYLPR